MAITDDVRKTLTDATPLYALAGVGDLAVEKLREVPELAASLAADRKAAQEKATERLHQAQARLTEAQAKVTEQVGALPTDFKQLQERAQGFALQQVGRAAELAVKAREVYDELAERGRTVVERERGHRESAPAGEIPGKEADSAAGPKAASDTQPGKPAAQPGAQSRPAAKRTTPRKPAQNQAKPSSES
ncbi:hypothetical protein [Phaeacidiphilus oryzae]|jgi:polyhydroxyalkanoate synthesis regulator phasin|uniref:hypothetical protein n=1 Tax=Phaeacidiphilus oryzae TaxID=348818 RepID=UPI00056C6B33|nr:hypothetical protein [Phaeacidiphilus oryzae]